MSSAELEEISRLLTALGLEKMDPLRRMRDGEAPPVSNAQSHAGHQMRIEARKQREAEARRIFGRRNTSSR